MYEENNYTYKVGINWKDILIKIVLLVLFILLLLWLFPRPNLDVFYDNVYNQNINTMKDAAKSYYTVDKLPKNVGDQSSMTLKEMFDNHLLIRFTDKNGATCDESSSKVEVTKISDNEYALKVQLNCGDQKDYILETIGCTNVCSNGTCQTVIVDGSSSNNNNNGNDLASNGNSNNDDDDYSDPKFENITKVTYYQHKKAVTTTKTVYTCPAGYKKEGTKCTKTTIGATIDATPVYNPDETIIVDAKYITEGGTEYVEPIKTKVKTEYTCPDGYTINGSFCIKYTDATPHKGEDKYICPSDEYTLVGTNCIKTYDATYKPGTTTYSCPNGGDLNGTKCTITIDGTPYTTYTCPSGYTPNGSSCYKIYDATPKTSYTCKYGETPSNGKCTYNATPNTTYTCKHGETPSNGKCTYNATANTTYGSWINKGTKYYTSANQAYTGTTSKLVFEGAISGSVCGSPCGNSGIWYKYTYYTRSVNTTYTCKYGETPNNGKCTYNATPNTTYTCKHGETPSNGKCTYNATPKTTYTCPDGGDLNGTKCTLTATGTPKTEYKCPTGYTPNGSKCTYTYNATPKTSAGTYTCPDGGDLNGTKCTITEKATKVAGEITYTCPSGYKLNGTMCEYKISATATDIYEYTCPTGYTKEGNGENTKCYKVSETTKYYCEDTSATLEGTKCIKTVKGSVKYYTCPADYTLSDDKCIKKSTITIDATATTEKSTSYKYTWSKNSYLEGWTFTGKTKVVEEKYSAGQK